MVCVCGTRGSEQHSINTVGPSEKLVSRVQKVGGPRFDRRGGGCGMKGRRTAHLPIIYIIYFGEYSTSLKRGFSFSLMTSGKHIFQRYSPILAYAKQTKRQPFDSESEPSAPAFSLRHPLCLVAKQGVRKAEDSLFALSKPDLSPILPQGADQSAS